MQLTWGGLRARVLLLLVALLALVVLPATARADKDNQGDPPAVTPKDVPTPPIAKEQPSRPEDTSTKRVALEMSAYTDTDNVTVFTPSVTGTVENVTQGASLSGHYLVDVVSAASVDIVSTASQRWNEVRQAGGLEGTYKPHDTGVTVAGSMSSEPDYLSISTGAQVTRDFNEKNTTLLLGYGYGHDTVGYHFTPFSVYSRIVQTSTISAGLTQVINRSTVGSLAFDVAFEDGDQSKPYRYIPMFSPDVAPIVPNGASIQWVTENRLPERPLEQLPLSRQRLSLTGRLAERLDGSTLRLEERIYGDSWLLVASSSDLRWIVDLGRRVQVWPHARFHAQNGVNFWSRAYVSEPMASPTSFVLPEFRTGNRELGPLVSETGGGGIKVFLGSAGNPKSLSIAVHIDGSVTSYLDDLYITARGSLFGALILEGEL
jgi:Protein of unknown function (DUF3570)